MSARKTTRRDLVIGALWMCTLIAVPMSGCAAWGWWKGEPDDVYADCVAFEAELNHYRAVHGRYPDTLQEADINLQRAHSQVVRYENKGKEFWASLQGNYYRYSGVSGQYWDLTTGAGGG